jgi:exodeoxyribonuclease VII large subunit
VVTLLPDRQHLALALQQQRILLRQAVNNRLQQERLRLAASQERLVALHPRQLLANARQQLQQRIELLHALSPRRLLERGFTLLHGADGQLVRSVRQVSPGDALQVVLADGRINTVVQTTEPGADG